MPAFGAMLPDRTVWELVAYIQSIGETPGPQFGTTTSADIPRSEQARPARRKAPRLGSSLSRCLRAARSPAQRGDAHLVILLSSLRAKRIGTATQAKIFTKILQVSVVTRATMRISVMCAIAPRIFFSHERFLHLRVSILDSKRIYSR
jgi:hypothetical protein